MLGPASVLLVLRSREQENKIEREQRNGKKALSLVDFVHVGAG